MALANRVAISLGARHEQERLQNLRRELQQVHNLSDAGAAFVLLTEAREGYAYRLRAVGHLFEAEDEAQEWPELHAAIRDVRTHYQAGEQMPDWQALDDILASKRHRLA